MAWAIVLPAVSLNLFPFVRSVLHCLRYFAVAFFGHAAFAFRMEKKSHA
jgi:hypothetical protein